MTINVYWTRANPVFDELTSQGLDQRSFMSPMRLAAPEPLLKHIDYKEFFGPSVSKCPAIIDDLKNIFVIKSPVDITIKLGDNALDVDHQSLEFAKTFLGNPQGKFGIHQLSMSYLFFSEKSLVATQLPAYYDQNGFTDNTFTISASFDIGKWYRPAAKPAFIVKPGVKKVEIKQGDALLYFKLNTSEKVKLIEFDDCDFKVLKENSPQWACGALKRQSNSVIPLAKCYEYFEQYKMRQKILKLIKNNTLD